MLNALADLLSGIPGLDWIPKVLDHWWHAPLGDKVFEVVRLILELAGAWELGQRGYGWIFRRRDYLERKIEVLEHGEVLHRQEVAKLRTELSDRTKELTATQARLPDAAIAKAEREWSQKNKQLALRHLDEWYQANAGFIATIGLHLARFHIAQAIPEPGDHLTRAAALIRLTRGADPDNREVLEVSAQFDQINADLQAQFLRDGEKPIAWNANIGRDPGGVTLIFLLRDVARLFFGRGLRRLVPIYADRAADLAAQGGPQLRKIWCEAEATAAFYQGTLGQYAESLVRLENVLSVATAHFPGRDTVVLMARHFKAAALSNLGRSEEALKEIDDFAPIEADVLGARHSDTLTTRNLRAQALSNLGRYDDALKEIDDFASIQAEVLGARHPSTLTTRYQRAQALSNLGLYEEALKEIDDFAPIRAEVLGARHPNTLTTRYLRAQALSDLGRYDDALKEIDDFAPIQADVLGARHRNALATQSLRIGVRIASGAAGDVTNELPALIAALARACGPHNTVTLGARYRLARALWMGGHLEQARSEIAGVLAGFDPATAASHELRRSAEALMNAIEGRGTEGDLRT